MKAVLALNHFICAVAAGLLGFGLTQFYPWSECQWASGLLFASSALGVGLALAGMAPEPIRIARIVRVRRDF